MQIKNVRFIIVAITTFSAYAVYVSRVNLSITIIAMVDDSLHQQRQHQAATSVSSASGRPTSLANSSSDSGGQIKGAQQAANDWPDLHDILDSANHTRHRMSIVDKPAANSTTLAAGSQLHQDTRPLRGPFSTFFPNSKESLFHTPLISQDKFDWSPTEQGHILGAFFYGYIIFQIPGARMAELVGARWIMMVATAGSALISFIFPLSTQLNSIYLLMVLRFVMGLCQSAFFPAAYVFFCRWLPESERSVLLPIMFIGSNIGSISTYTMSSYLISASYGWPSVFYVSGFINLLVTILWIVFGSNGPRENWLITDEECNFIQASMGLSQTGSKQQDDVSTLSVNNGRNKIVTIKLNNLNECQKESQGTVADKLLLKTHINRGQQLLSQQHPLAKSKSANDLLPVATAAAAARLDFNNNSLSPPMTLVDINNNSGGRPEDRKHLATRLIVPAPLDEAAPVVAQANQLCWLKLISSLPIWTLVLSMYGNEWSQVVLTYELPTYLNKALNFPIEQNGVINSFFQLSYTLASPIMSALGAYMLDRHLLKMRKIHVRKLFQSLATFGQLACFVSVPICGANRGLIIMFMFSAIVFKSCANAGDIMVSGDLSPDYAGTIYAFANSIGNTAGVLVPLLAGLIVSNPNQREQWTPFWLTTATIMGCSGLIFLVFGETSQQNFSIDAKDKHKQEERGKHRAITAASS